jgi:hypothetical protein
VGSGRHVFESVEVVETRMLAELRE